MKIKLYLFLTLTLLISSSLLAQVKNGYRPDENDSLYIQALKEYITKQKTHTNRYIESNLEEKTLYLLWDVQISDLPKMVDGHRIIFLNSLDSKQKKKLYKENNKKLMVIDIMTLTFDKGLFEISFEQWETKLGRRKFVEKTRYGMRVTTYFKADQNKVTFDYSEVGGFY